MVDKVSASRLYENVEIKYKDYSANVRIQRGCVFENKAKKYVVDNQGNLSVFNKETKTWSEADYIGMTEYQFNAFRAIANNKFEFQDKITYSAEDIERANQQYKKGGFFEDIKQFLTGTGYKPTKVAKNPSSTNMGVNISNGKAKQSGLVTFKLASDAELKASSTLYNQKSDIDKADDGEFSALERLSSLPSTEEKIATMPNTSCVKYKYTVEKGDTIYSIARQYSIDPKTLMANNGMNNNTKLEIGQTIVIPKIVYEVQKGDNLIKIADQFGYEYEVLQDENNIEKSNELKIGQKLDIPGYLYTVQKGDNLTQIAKKAGMSVDVLKKVNGLKDSTIRVGQNLIILFNDGTYNIPDEPVKPTPVSPTKPSKPSKPDSPDPVLNEGNVPTKTDNYALLKRPTRRNGRIVATTRTFNPTKKGPLSGKTIIVNAGHGYKANGVLDAGAPNPVKSQRDEVYYNYDNAMKLKDHLCYQGAKVIFIQGSKSLVQSEIKNSKALKNADMFISVHTNSAKTQDRTQLFTRQRSAYSKALSNSNRLAKSMENRFDRWIPKNEKISSKDKFVFQGKQDYAQVSANDARTGILETPMSYGMPSVLWEVAYITTKKGRERLNDNKLMHNYSSIMTQSVVNYFS